MSMSHALRLGGLLVLISLSLRLVAMTVFPLFDTTEARYGEMARLMWETGNWVTPLFDYGVPFWGKPPLQTWASAAGISILGLSELAVRLPHFLAGLLIMFMSYRFAQVKTDKDHAWLVLFVLGCTPGFLLCIGMVMTDTLLTLAVTVSMLSSWWLIHHKSQLTQRAYGLLFFVGLGIGMLAKGPVALVLVGLALLPWLLVCRHFYCFIRQLPWVSGTAVMLLICAPWYLAAEQATPGFLQYFIVGEHWLRFTVPGWQGDLYGNAHERTKGTIWLYIVYGSLPWLPWLIWQGIKKRQALVNEQKSQVLFLICWWLAPAMLFTFAGNILPAYVLPGVPAMALLVLTVAGKEQIKQLLAMGLFAPLLLGTLLFMQVQGKVSQSSDKDLLSKVVAETQSAPVFYIHKRPFSGQFYSAGQAKVLSDLTSAEHKSKQPAYFVVEKNIVETSFFDKKHCVIRNQNHARLLYYCPGN